MCIHVSVMLCLVLVPNLSDPAKTFWFVSLLCIHWKNTGPDILLLYSEHTKRCEKTMNNLITSNRNLLQDHTQCKTFSLPLSQCSFVTLVWVMLAGVTGLKKLQPTKARPAHQDSSHKITVIIRKLHLHGSRPQRLSSRLLRVWPLETAKR